jgi:hypothetical protein
MNLEQNPMESALDEAVNRIRDEAIDDAVVEAAAARVWAKLSAQVHAPLRTCSDFQALIPDFKAGRLPESRALLVKDHLHECVACRRIYEGRVVAMPDVQDDLRKHGLEITGSTPEQFTAHIKAEKAVWAKVIKNAGIKPE